MPISQGDCPPGFIDVSVVENTELKGGDLHRDTGSVFTLRKF